ncbi:MAG TPA: S1 RNA-binding domain-containing protein [Candidatus Kapabacteria bacterium]|nr:S1 RNA-binding domain-containing protein [Candidatus Kapabacteria bacterium]
MSNIETLENNQNTDNSSNPTNVTINQATDSEFKNAVENSNDTPTDKTEQVAVENNEANSAQLEEYFSELKSLKESNTTTMVKITSKIKGGFKAIYKELSVFLPFSQFSLMKNLNDEVINDAVGKEFQVNIYDLQEDDSKRKTVIVSRKQILENEFWGKVKVGDIVEGPVSSVAAFGVFLDLGGNEGLIHISRLSNTRVQDTKSFAKVGDVLKAKVIDIDKEKNRIALSSRELENTAWTGVSEKLKVGDKVKAVVKRIVDYGAYLEVLPGIDGLLRNNELSWTLRIKNVKTLFKVNDEIEVVIISLNEEKHSMALSYKQVNENPWASLADKYTKDSNHKGVVQESNDKGCVVRIDNEIDGFMPKSKMRGLAQDANKYDINKELDVVVLDIDLEKQNIILKPLLDESEEQANNNPRTYNENKERQPRENKPVRKDRQERGIRENRGDRSSRTNYDNRDNSNASITTSINTVTLADMLDEAMKKSLMKN